MATLQKRIEDPAEISNPNVVKVVTDRAGDALYFSRYPIPYVRDSQPDFGTEPPCFLQHLGLYAYRREFLLQLAALPPEPVFVTTTVVTSVIELTT